MASRKKNKQRADDADDSYKRYISNIAYRFGFQVTEEDGTLFKIVDGEKTTILSENEVHPHDLWRLAWIQIKDEYSFNGIWKESPTDWSRDH